MKHALGAFALVATLACHAAMAQVAAEDPWVRGTVPSQTVTGAFMTLRSVQDASLIGVDTPAAASVEIHEMRMEGDVARMRPVDHLVLPAGKAVHLRPGGYHLMLIDLKRPLKTGDVVPLKLRIRNGDGSQHSIEARAAVRALGADANHHHGGHH